MASSRFVLGVVVSGGFHVLAYVQMQRAEASVGPSRPATVIEIESPPPTPPKEEPKADEAPSPDSAPAAPQPPSARPVPPSKAPPPSAAQAGKTLTAADDAPGIADFTMVQGTGAYAGGITSSAGTSKTAVTSAPPSGSGPEARAVGTGGNGTRPTGPDLSKPARPVGNDWDCKALFPSEATDDTATVLIVARVRPDGTAESVSIVKDPGQGFARAARSCAMRQRYAAAEDRDGRAVVATTAPFRVRFTR